MQYRRMGKLDWEVSTLSFGGMRLPTLEAWYNIDYSKAGGMLKYAIDQGVNYLDTAWPYHKGASEVFFGEVLESEYRDKVKIATKSPVWLVESKRDFHKYLDKQRKNLKTECIDFYLFHALNKDRWEKVVRLGLLDEMLNLRSAGKIDKIGFSFHGAADTFKTILGAFDWDMTQIQYNYLDTDFQATIRGLDYAHEKNIAVVVMEPLRGGKLAESNASIGEILRTSPVQKALVEWAIHFVLNHPGVSTLLSGMGTQEQVIQNIDFVNSFKGPLNDLELQTLAQLKAEYQSKIKVPCTSCKYCVPCPEGVDIPENLFLLNQAFWSGKAEDWMKNWYREFESDDPETNWHGKGAASRCTTCGECLDKCPQSIDIPDELDVVRRLFEKGVDVEDI